MSFHRAQALSAGFSWNGIVFGTAAPGLRRSLMRMQQERTNMSIFNKVTKTFQWGQHTVTLETGEIARQATGAVVVDIDGTVVLCHRGRFQVGQARPGLLPADRRLHREDLRRRQDPRQLLQARSQAQRTRNADQPPDRPPDPPAVPRRLLQRSARRHPHAVAEPRSRCRHRRHDRLSAPRCRSPASRSPARSAPRAWATSTANTC